MDALTTFADRREFERAMRLLDEQDIAFGVVSPDPAYVHVACPALVLSEEAKTAFLAGPGTDVMTSGWVDFRYPAAAVPDAAPREFAEDLLGRVAIVLLAPCVADPDRLRLIAHLGGDVAEALPYVNAVLPNGSYVVAMPVLTFMDGPRMISVFRDRIAVAKAADIVDAWAALEHVRELVNDAWQRRAQIMPSFELRQRPSALEIYKRLPRTNCRRCGEATCMAFAWAVWRGEAHVRRCLPVFQGDRVDLKDALLTLCSGLGLTDD